MADKKLTRIEDKLDKIVDRISAIDVTLGKQAVSLEEHVKRSNMLEDNMKPIQKHVDRVSGIVKFLGFVIAALTSIEGGHILLNWLKL